MQVYFFIFHSPSRFFCSMLSLKVPASAFKFGVADRYFGQELRRLGRGRSCRACQIRGLHRLQLHCNQADESFAGIHAAATQPLFEVRHVLPPAAAAGLQRVAGSKSAHGLFIFSHVLTLSPLPRLLYRFMCSLRYASTSFPVSAVFFLSAMRIACHPHPLVSIS